MKKALLRSLRQARSEPFRTVGKLMRVHAQRHDREAASGIRPRPQPFPACPRDVPSLEHSQFYRLLPARQGSLVAAILAILTIGFVSGCGDGDSGGMIGPRPPPPVAPPPPPPVNWPPQPQVQPPDQMVIQGDTISADISGWFTDANGDALTYAASSAAEEIVQVWIAADSVHVAALAVGEASVTVRATDPGALWVEVSYLVMVEERNLAPEIARQIEAQQLFTGDSLSLVLSEHFSDPNGDTLTYMVSAGDAVEAEIRADTLLLIGNAEDTTDVVVTATDPAGLSAEQSFRVRVEEENLAPEIARQIEPQQLFTGDSLSLVLSEHFSDPNGDTLTYMVSAGDAVEAEIRVDTLLLIGKAEDTADVMVMATDPAGLSAEQSFRVRVEEENLAPEIARQIEPQQLFTGDSLSLVLSEHFSDPNGDTLTYMVSAGDAVEAEIRADTLLLIGKAEDTTDVVVTGDRPGWLVCGAVVPSVRGRGESRA